jgi:hypothetical protein
LQKQRGMEGDIEASMEGEGEVLEGEVQGVVSEETPLRS